MSKQINWYKIADHIAEINFSDNNIAEVEVNGKKICIVKHKEELFAVAQKCPHAGGYLANGYVDALGNIVCPLHRYKFSCSNGRNVSGEGYYLKHWPVEHRADGIYIGMEKSSGLFGLFK